MKTPTEIIDALRQPLEKERVKKRDGAGGKKLSYIETHDAIETANRIFGFDGWGHILDAEPTHFPNAEAGKGMFFARVTVWAMIDERRVEHGDIGVGLYRKGSQEEIEKGIKEAVSDGIKRGLRAFGDQFGNCLYDKLAVEHNGEQRPAVANSQILEKCEALRQKAVALGYVIPSGPAQGKVPSPLNAEATQKTAENRIAIFEKFIANNPPSQAAPQTSPQSPPQQTQSQTALTQEPNPGALFNHVLGTPEYTRFLDTVKARGLKWETAQDVSNFENIMTDKTGNIYVAAEMNANDFGGVTVLIANEELTW